MAAHRKEAESSNSLVLSPFCILIIVRTIGLAILVDFAALFPFPENIKCCSTKKNLFEIYYASQEQAFEIKPVLCADAIRRSVTAVYDSSNNL